MNTNPETLKILVLLPLGVLFMYSTVVAIGNHWILRAGGQTAHENYPKVIDGMKNVFVGVFISSILFILVIYNYIPSEVLVTLVSIFAGVFGTIFLQRVK